MQFLIVTDNPKAEYLIHDWKLFSSLHPSQARGTRRVFETEEHASKAIQLHRFRVNRKGVIRKERYLVCVCNHYSFVCSKFRNLLAETALFVEQSAFSWSIGILADTCKKVFQAYIFSAVQRSQDMGQDKTWEYAFAPFNFVWFTSIFKFFYFP